MKEIRIGIQKIQHQKEEGYTISSPLDHYFIFEVEGVGVVMEETRGGHHYLFFITL